MAKNINNTTTAGWLNLDAWSETYIGAHWLLKNELPDFQYQAEVHHGPLSQMVLLAAHQLVEIMFFQCVKSAVKQNKTQFIEIERSFEKASFWHAFKTWPETLTGYPFDLTQEPLKSAHRLKDWRNATVHKSSALTSLEMARSALFSGVEASKTIAEHFGGGLGFKYKFVLSKYPLQQEPWFSQIQLIEEAT